MCSFSSHKWFLVNNDIFLSKTVENLQDTVWSWQLYASEQASSSQGCHKRHYHNLYTWLCLNWSAPDVEWVNSQFTCRVTSCYRCADQGCRATQYLMTALVVDWVFWYEGFACHSVKQLLTKCEYTAWFTCSTNTDYICIQLTVKSNLLRLK